MLAGPFVRNAVVCRVEVVDITQRESQPTSAGEGSVIPYAMIELNLSVRSTSGENIAKTLNSEQPVSKVEIYCLLKRRLS